MPAKSTTTDSHSELVLQAMLEQQRLELTARYEVDKQKAVNQGTWLGGVIGAVSAIVVAAVPFVLKDKTPIAGDTAVLKAKIEEYMKYSESLKKQIDWFEEREKEGPDIISQPVKIGLSKADCELRAASVGADLGVKKLPSSAGYAGSREGVAITVHCNDSLALVASAGNTAAEVQALFYQFRDKLK